MGLRLPPRLQTVRARNRRSRAGDPNGQLCTDIDLSSFYAVA